jgi:hypothetical protein
MGTVGGMFAGWGVAWGAEKLTAGNAIVVASGWVVGAALAVWIANRFADGHPFPPLFAGGFLYIAILQALFTDPHPIWMLAVGGLGVPLVGAATWWFTREEYE